MAIQFPSGKYASKSASWLDNMTSFSFYARIRFDTVVTANQQYVWMHRTETSAGDQVSLRKTSTGDDTGDLFRCSTTATNPRTETGTTTIVAGTAYDVMFSWIFNTAAPNGLRLYVNGAQEGSGQSTTNQTSGISISGGLLWLGARNRGFNSGICSLERMFFFPNYQMTTAQYDALRKGAWPHQLGNLPIPGAFFPMFGSDATRIQDYSGNGHGYEAADITSGPLSTTNTLGLWMPPSFGLSTERTSASGGSGPPAPEPWTDLAPDIDATSTGPKPPTALVSGLTNGLPYEFKVICIDTQGNPSVDSDIAEATPTTVTTTSVTPVPWRRSRSLSKYRSGST